jgi:hypothetical protein
MNIRPFVAIAAVAALCACNSNKGGNTASNAASNSSNAAAATGGTGGTGTVAAGTNGARTVDPQLEQEISMAVQMLKPQLPLKQGAVTVTDLASRGGELIYTMEVPNDLTAETFEQFKQQLPIQACANPQAKQMFERGGTYTYILKDPGGEEFTTSVSSC